MTIWVNEQIDPSGMIHACIACCNESQAKDCHHSFENNLSETQKAAGWVARLRTVDSWDECTSQFFKTQLTSQNSEL